MLVISDRNTTGLGGPTRADVIDRSTSTDFVDFLRNIGQPPDKPLGGGTFGYGKAALYLVSGIRCILVYTRCRYRGRLESRLIAACLGQGYVDDSGPVPTKYTGRHWWGVIGDDSEVAEPLTGEPSARLAAALGIPPFQGDETGTSIAILDFSCGPERGPDEALLAMQTALLWNFWPKMLDCVGSGPAIHFSVFRDGAERSLPKLEEYPPLDGFREAMLVLKERRAGKPLQNPHARFHEVRIQRPKALLGWLCLIRFPHRAREKGRPKSGALGGVELAACHHIALMRNAELVVKYLPGLAPTTDVLDWAGVFVTTEEVDRAFAASEPPTHDDWVSENLADGTDRRFVNVALREVSRFAEEFSAPGSSRRADSASVPLGVLSRSLARLLTGASGPDADVSQFKGPRHKSTEVTNVGIDERMDDDSPDASDDASGTAGERGSGFDSGTGALDGDPGVESPPSSSPDDQSRIGPPVRAGRPKIKAGKPQLELLGDIGCVVVPFVLRHGVHTRTTRIRANVQVEIDGSQTEREAPAGAQVPKVLFWEDESGTQIGHGEDELVIPSSDGGAPQPWRVWIQLIDDARVQTTLEAEGVE
jgi:hypothetical protein